MDYDYEDILASYRERYAGLAEQATPGSSEQHTYAQIVRFLDQNTTEPPQKRAFQLTMTFLELAKDASRPEVRAIYRACGLDLNRDTGQERWRF